MLKNYLKIAYRNLLKHKVLSLINILGLAIGMTACLLILRYVQFELSYNNFHAEKNNIYRVDVSLVNDGEAQSDGKTYPGLGPAIKEDVPGVKAFVRLHNAFGETTVSYQSQIFKEDKIFFTDSTFFEAFSFPLLKGNPKTALAEPNSIVLSESTAKKYFGAEDPMDKVLVLHDLMGENSYRVTGICQDVLANSSIDFDLLLSNHNLLKINMYQDSWVWSNFYTYIWLQPNTDGASVQAQLTNLNHKYTGKDYKKSGAQQKYYLIPLDKMHLYSRVNLVTGQTNLAADGKQLVFLVIIAAFILVIGFINYVNLSTARSIERAKEVGVRKSVGAQRHQLLKQFLVDTALINGLAFGVALTVAQCLLPLLAQFLGKPVTSLGWNQLSFWGILAVALLSCTLLTGLYPAFSLSAFRPMAALKGKFSHSAKGIFLRKTLITFQFAVSMALIAGTLAVYHQLAYMRKQDLGINIEQTLVLKAPNYIKEKQTYEQKWHVFKNELLALSAVKNVTASDNVPGKGYKWTQENIRREGVESSSDLYNIVEIDYDFVPSYQLKILSGRNFSEEFRTDRQKVLINKTAVQNLGFDSPEAAIGQNIMVLEGKLEVIGVVDDYHQKSLRYGYDPIIYALAPFTQWFYSLKVDTDDLPTTMSTIQAKWKDIFPENPFEYFFLDELFNQQYQADRQFNQVFAFFSLLAIFIACLGLFGLSSYTIVQRTKEIGIRKVLGASVRNIVTLLSKDFITLIFIASVLALPLAYLFIQKWLQNYAFRIEISGWLLLIPVAIVLLIALLTVSFQTIKAALANPVKSLKYE